ncbi:hypothetical protein BGY98DRAFT_1029655 [Russula aff. rugulosa BPL654]|nr:hypothetical protein BGY98DRAFT_1029655 [Russula aff. rugulosa BPL654]
MALAHRVYLAYPSFRCHPHRWSSRPIASNSSNRISTRAVAATSVAIYIIDRLLRHRARKGRCAQDDRVQSALAGCPSRASGPPLKLIAIQRSDCTSDPPNFVSHGSSFLITLSIFFLSHCVMHTRILQTRSRAFFFSVVITVVTINTSTTFSQSVSRFHIFFLHPVIVLLLFQFSRQSGKVNLIQRHFFTV